MSGSNIWLLDIFRRHHRDLVRYAARLLGDRDSGEEVVQNTYMRLASRGSESGTIELPKAYVFSAARNAAIDFAARQNQEWLHRVDITEIGDLAATEEPSEALHRRQQIVRMAILLNELPAACRAVFVMNRIEGRRHREIAEQMGISVSMVEKHVVRAMTHLRNLMREGEET
ncbi:MAG: sigma-70 family RNA polymerase sigma factor [Mesorhizobium sp.]